jgi:prepilin-type N-terminal cleavage/methylation domain-containing protein
MPSAYSKTCNPLLELQKRAKSQPTTKKGECEMKKSSGFTLVEIMIVVAIIGLLAAIAIPSFVKARNTSQQNACINNLRMIDAGKEQAAMELNWSGSVNCDDPSNKSNVLEYIKKAPFCPASGTYTFGDLDQVPTCNIATPSHAL